MASQTEICNLALTKLGESNRITTIDDDTKPARELKAVYDMTRDALLRGHRWHFAMTRTALASLVAAPAWGYDTQFQLPPDFLRLDFVGDFYVGTDLSEFRGTESMFYALEGGKLLCDLDDPLNIRYVARIEDTSLYDPLFNEAFACKLGLQAVEALTQSNSKQESIAAQYDVAIREAKRTNAIERPPTPLADDTWMTARA